MHVCLVSEYTLMANKPQLLIKYKLWATNKIDLYYHFKKLISFKAIKLLK